MAKKQRKPRTWWVTVGTDDFDNNMIYDSYGSKKDALEAIEWIPKCTMQVVKVVEVLPKRAAKEAK